MLGRVVEVADDDRHVHVSRGFLVVSSKSTKSELGQIPLDDIAALIVNAHGVSYSNNALIALASRGIPTVLCGSNHNVVGMVWSADGHHEQGRRFDAQVSATQQLKKRIWADIVRGKIGQQTLVLEAAGIQSPALKRLLGKVRVGDPANVEAQAAKIYWPLLFHSDFRRNRHDGGLNSFLNYGYAVLRSLTARAVVAAGLHPTFGLHHSNAGNAFRLVDDLMEPFRPCIDYCVFKLATEDPRELQPTHKRELVNALYTAFTTPEGAWAINDCVQRAAWSLAQVFLGEKMQIQLLLPEIPLEFVGIGASLRLEDD